MAVSKNKFFTTDDVKVGPPDQTFISIPPKMTIRKVLQTLQAAVEDQETWTNFHDDFMVRPWDGAHAVKEVVREKYGASFQRGQQSFFGSQSPDLITIKVGVDKTDVVPWGEMEVPLLGNATLTLGQRNHEDYGQIFHISVEAQKMYKNEIMEFFVLVREYLKEHSIYKGHAIVGVDNPDFLDLREFHPEDVVYSDFVLETLEGNFWGPMQMTKRYEEDGISLKRSGLLFGPFGTGKTLAGQVTAQIAEENGWTFIAARPGKDGLEDVLRTARLYMPAVVFFEDVDSKANSDGGYDEMTTILDAFDGITNKGGKLMCIMTTNHAERIQQGMLRPGRLDATIKIAELDRHGVETLIRRAIKTNALAEDTDFDVVYESMTGFYPAFVKECVTRALSMALYKSGGAKDYTIGTHELVNAAKSLRPQLELMERANEKTERPTMDAAIGDIVRDMNSKVLNDTYLGNRDGSSLSHKLVVSGNGKK